MKMKTIVRTTLTAAVLLTGSAFAFDSYGPAGSYYDYAKVVHVEPVYRIVRVNQPTQECWTEKHVQYNRRDNTGPTILGGLIGGVVGHQIGDGRGRDAATIAGVLLGGKIARDMNKSQYPDSRRVVHEDVCETVDHFVEEQRLDFYRVTYRYHGQEYTTRMERDPGNKVRVSVNVALAE